MSEGGAAVPESTAVNFLLEGKEPQGGDEMDFNFVNNRVATGAAISSSTDVDVLVKAGVTHIIDCRAEFDDAGLLQGRNIGYLYNGVWDDGKPKPVDWFQKSINFALAALVQPHNKVYAHCAAGVNRGPSTCYSILRALGMNQADAEATIRKARPQVGLYYKKDADAAITQLGYE
jgi:hypothetical protein